jgi:tRNA threonylcarbamoyladenosine biosynthesis protein TsaE
MALDLNLPDAAATVALGATLAKSAGPGRVLYLRGELGSGKTTLVRGLLRALGHTGRVKSPSFTLVEPYMLSSLHFYHFDFYRLKNQEEWEQAEFREYFDAHAMCVVEWPERAGSLLSPPDLDIHLHWEPKGRRAQLSAHTEPGRRWLSSLRLSS